MVESEAMKENELFKMALGLTPPWEVVAIDFSAADRRLTIEIDFPAGSEFPCPRCSLAGCKGYDSKKTSWRHLNFFQHETLIEARVPRVTCPKCGVKQVEVPWSRPGSGFTLLFEALIMILCKDMPVNAVARIIGEHDTRIWRVLDHYVGEARTKADFSGVTKVGIDETASKRGHNYVTLFVDLEKARVLYATEGKGAETLKEFAADLSEHKAAPEQITELGMDMSPAFISGAERYFPEAAVTFDRFHGTKIMNEAVDKVRKEERGERPELSKTRYIWLKNPVNLTRAQAARLDEIGKMRKLNLRTMRAYHIRLNFQEFWNQTPDKAEAFLKKWYFWATHSRLKPIIQAARTVKKHWYGILRWFKSGINNGILEGINSLVQAAKARARGYRTSKNLITMIYMIAGKLNYGLPT